MSGGIEAIEVVEPWLYGVLHGDLVVRGLTRGQVSSTQAAGPLDPPYVSFNYVSGRDVVAAGGHRFWSDMLYDVRVVAATSSWTGDIAVLGKRIDVLLHGVDGVSADTEHGRVECRRERPIVLVEQVRNVQHRHLGGRFRIKAYSA